MRGIPGNRLRLFSLHRIELKESRLELQQESDRCEEKGWRERERKKKKKKKKREREREGPTPEEGPSKYWRGLELGGSSF